MHRWKTEYIHTRLGGNTARALQLFDLIEWSCIQMIFMASVSIIRALITIPYLLLWRMGNSEDNGAGFSCHPPWSRLRVDTQFHPLLCSSPLNTGAKCWLFTCPRTGLFVPMWFLMLKTKRFILFRLPSTLTSPNTYTPLDHMDWLFSELQRAKSDLHSWSRAQQSLLVECPYREHPRLQQPWPPLRPLLSSRHLPLIFCDTTVMILQVSVLMWLEVSLFCLGKCVGLLHSLTAHQGHVSQRPSCSPCKTGSCYSSPIEFAEPQRCDLVSGKLENLDELDWRQ